MPVLATGGTGGFRGASQPLAEAAGHDVLAPGAAELDLIGPPTLGLVGPDVKAVLLAKAALARDLHDVVAHNITVINVQANTALHLMDRQPDRARTALTTIDEVSRRALAELRWALGVVRAAGESAPGTPTPGLARLGDLADTAAAAGLTVGIEECGQRAQLPTDVDLGAYRIVQEALTNSARHSGGTNVTVRVACRDDALVVEVDDFGPLRPPARPPGHPQGTGSGIAGMTERAAALGGTLQARPRPGGGFAVRAWLPLRQGPQHGGDR